MMRWRLRELMGRSSDLRGKKITYDVIFAETGLSKTVLTRIGSNKAKRAELGTIEILLDYFSRILDEELRIEDLLIYEGDSAGTNPP